MKNNNLDERQEQTLLRIESRGFWLAFWGSLVVMVVQGLLAKEPVSIISYWALFMVLAFYVAISSVRAGIWDRKLETDQKTCACISMIAAASTGGFMFFFIYLRGKHLKIRLGHGDDSAHKKAYDYHDGEASRPCDRAADVLSYRSHGKLGAQRKNAHPENKQKSADAEAHKRAVFNGRY